MTTVVKFLSFRFRPTPVTTVVKSSVFSISAWTVTTLVKILSFRFLAGRPQHARQRDAEVVDPEYGGEATPCIRTRTAPKYGTHRGSARTQGDGAGGSAQRGTSGAATGPGGRSPLTRSRTAAKTR